MKKNRSLLSVLSAITFTFLLTISGWSQELPVERGNEDSEIEITDDMVDQFVSVTDILNTIQKDAQIEMIDAIDHQGLTIEEFNEMVNMEKFPDDEETKAISREDKIAFDNAKKQVDQIRSEMELRMDDAIVNSGLELDEYEAIQEAYDSDVDVRKRVDRRMGSKR